MKLVKEASYNKSDLERVKRVKSYLNNCIFERRRGEWDRVLIEISAPLFPRTFLPYAWPEVIFTKCNNILSERVLTMRMP